MRAGTVGAVSLVHQQREAATAKAIEASLLSRGSLTAGDTRRA